MTLTDAVILGIIQGLTEFMPVSSSGHLVLAEKVLGISPPPIFFNSMVHLGTLVAVLIVLHRDVLALLKRPFQRMTGLLIVSTLPTIAIALAFNRQILYAFDTGIFLGGGFLFTAAFLFLAEFLHARAAKKGFGKDELAMTYPDALLIGVLQGIAVFPAISRFGLTVGGALARGLDRTFAAHFSLLMCIPAIVGAVSWTALAMVGGEPAEATFTLPIVVGTLTSMVVGCFTVSAMFKLIKKGTMRGFAVYVAVLGALITLDQFVLHFLF